MSDKAQVPYHGGALDGDGDRPLFRAPSRRAARPQHKGTRLSHVTSGNASRRRLGFRVYVEVQGLTKKLLRGW